MFVCARRISRRPRWCGLQPIEESCKKSQFLKELYSRCKIVSTFVKVVFVIKCFGGTSQTHFYETGGKFDTRLVTWKREMREGVLPFYCYYSFGAHRERATFFVLAGVSSRAGAFWLGNSVRIFASLSRLNTGHQKAFQRANLNYPRDFLKWETSSRSCD